ncbi:MAG: hypothetical protein NXI16_16660 [Alphaproteobacteria bacterium]|nr:hypothetical protein [Alphaproteobacteria bacterium]
MTARRLPHALLLVLAAFISFWSSSAHALTNDQRIGLQMELVNYIDARTIDGEFVFFDPKEARSIALYPAHLHPKIVPIGEIYFLCASFRNTDGKDVEVDFVARFVNGQARIFQTLVDQRKVIRDLMKAQ